MASIAVSADFLDLSFNRGRVFLFFLILMFFGLCPAGGYVISIHYP